MYFVWCLFYIIYHILHVSRFTWLICLDLPLVPCVMCTSTFLVPWCIICTILCNLKNWSTPIQPGAEFCCHNDQTSSISTVSIKLWLWKLQYCLIEQKPILSWWIEITWILWGAHGAPRQASIKGSSLVGVGATQVVVPQIWCVSDKSQCVGRTTHCIQIPLWL